MHFTAILVLVSAAFITGTKAAHVNASSSFGSAVTTFVSSIAPNATAAFNGTNPGPTSVIAVPAPTGTVNPGNGSFICFPAGSGFITAFPTGINGADFPTGANGTNGTFPTPTGGFNASSIILSDVPVATASSA